MVRKTGLSGDFAAESDCLVQSRNILRKRLLERTTDTDGISLDFHFHITFGL